MTLWTLGGTPHRIRLATERMMEGIDRLQGATEALLADPSGGRYRDGHLPMKSRS
jgi:hypothetical protein